MNEEYRDFERPVRVEDTRGLDPPRQGVISRTLESSDGEPVYEVNYGPIPLANGAALFDCDVRRVASHERVVFLDGGGAT